MWSDSSGADAARGSVVRRPPHPLGAAAVRRHRAARHVVDDDRTVDVRQGRVRRAGAPRWRSSLALGGHARRRRTYARPSTWTQARGTNLLGANVTHPRRRWHHRVAAPSARSRSTATSPSCATASQDMDGVDEVVEADRYVDCLPGADLVVLALAADARHRGDDLARDELEMMESHAWLVNVARGRHIVTDDLVVGVAERHHRRRRTRRHRPRAAARRTSAVDACRTASSRHTSATRRRWPSRCCPSGSRQNVRRFATGEELLGPVARRPRVLTRPSRVRMPARSSGCSPTTIGGGAFAALELGAAHARRDRRRDRADARRRSRKAVGRLVARRARDRRTRRWSASCAGAAFATRGARSAEPAAERPSTTINPTRFARCCAAFVVDGRITQIPTARAKRLVVLDWLAQDFEPGERYTRADGQPDPRARASPTRRRCAGTWSTRDCSIAAAASTGVPVARSTRSGRR